MCKVVAVIQLDGSVRYADHKRELEHLLGGPVHGLEDLPLEGCICGFREEQAAAKYGYRIHSGHADPYRDLGCDIVLVPAVAVEGSHGR